MFDLKPELERRKKSGLYRRRRLISTAQGPQVTIDGRSLLSFCSNDYLGLANHAAIKQAFIDAVAHYGVGSGAAHLVSGHSQLHHDCEQRLAQFTGRERALLFSTGYMANLAIGSALLGRHDSVFQDKLNHASLVDAAKLSGAKLRRYRHNDMAHLATLLEQPQTNKSARLIMTDAVFSMDGDCADLVQLAKLAARSASWCMVDDAHGFGVLGKTGAGLLEAQQVAAADIQILMATLGKAAGTSGAFVAGSDELIETLIQQARPYIYTTAMPPAIAAATLKSIDIIEFETWRREKLEELITYFKFRMSDLDFELLPSVTAIQPLLTGTTELALKLSSELMQRGFHVVAIRPPTVPDGSARLRFTLSADHELQHIDRLVDCLKRLQ